MTILDVQKRLTEVGRIRLGEKGAKGQPVKLTKFRFTSQDEAAIKRIADLYGGEPNRWTDAPTSDQWEVTVEQTSIPVILPPSKSALSAFYELWSGGGCQRRCDGQTELLSDKPCLCDPDNRECKPTTRLAVILTDLGTSGVWRLETKGWNALTELSGSMEIADALGKGLTRAKLSLQERISKRDGKTHRFVVPVVEIDMGSGLTAIGTSNGAALSVAEQVAALDEPAPSRSRMPALPATGVSVQRATTPLPNEEPFEYEPPASHAPFEDGPVLASGESIVREREEVITYTTRTTDNGDLASEPQVKKLGIMFREAGLMTRDDKLAVCVAVTGREGIESSKDLTKREASAVIDHLEGLKVAG